MTLVVVHPGGGRAPSPRKPGAAAARPPRRRRGDLVGISLSASSWRRRRRRRRAVPRRRARRGPRDGGLLRLRSNRRFGANFTYHTRALRRRAATARPGADSRAAPARGAFRARRRAGSGEPPPRARQVILEGGAPGRGEATGAPSPPIRLNPGSSAVYPRYTGCCGVLEWAGAVNGGRHGDL